MKKLLITVFSIGLMTSLINMSTANAHHSAAPFDFSKQVDLKGKVKKFRIANPHAAIELEVTDEERGTRVIEFEGMSASTFYRAGYTRGSVKMGDEIEVKIAPRFTGEDGGFIMSFITPAGKNVGFRTADVEK